MILCWATLIALLGRVRPAGHGLDSPVLDYSLDNEKQNKKQDNECNFSDRT